MRAPAIPFSSPPPGPSWPMRLACLALLSPLLSLAQSPATRDAADPDATGAPLRYQAIPPQPPLVDAPPSPEAWRQAHDVVGAFPRGHADIVAWEAQRGAGHSPAPANSTAAPKPPHHQGMNHEGHGGAPRGHHHQPMQGGKP